ncbi:MAG: tRNA 2-selenouridine(34) synthase MnmH [Burkholderiales bacterium]|jgi:tRNA 2-selenouridine synthase|nr:tRNA 2-selenouridine(34) synthase MnmH [Burkholderiales bacterium]
MRLPDSVTVAQLDFFDELLDVRSPAEYAEDHIPRATSCPVLDDAERTEVGTLHKQVSPFAAKKRGAALVARNIARHIEERFHDKPKDWRPLVYCWRGGKRSGAMAHVLREIGWQAAQLAGGYKAYRREVVAQLETLPAHFRFVVVCGETGSAKSRLLAALAAAGAQALDLEGLARHRGSVLGDLPGEPQPAQKRFETLVWDRLRRFERDVPVFVEAESKKIGALQVPEGLIREMRASPCVRLEAPLSERVRFLIREYGHFLADRARLGAQLAHLEALHGKETIARWNALAAAGDWEALVADLLANHYDPAYRRSTAKNFSRFGAARVMTLESLAPDAIAHAARTLAAGPDELARAATA